MKKATFLIIVVFIISLVFDASFALDVRFAFEKGKSNLVPAFYEAAKYSVGDNYVPVILDNPSSVISAVASKRVDFALMDSKAIFELPSATRLKLCSFGSIPLYLHIATLRDKGIKNVYELLGKIVFVGIEKSESETASKHLFDAMKFRHSRDLICVNCEHLEYDKQLEKLFIERNKGGIDAFIELAKQPCPTITEVGKELHLIPVTERIVTEMAKKSRNPYHFGYIYLKNYLPKKKEKIPAAYVSHYFLSSPKIEGWVVDNILTSFIKASAPYVTYEDAFITTIRPLRNISKYISIHPYVGKKYSVQFPDLEK